MAKQSRQVNEQTAYLALASGILDDRVEISDDIFDVLDGKGKFKLNADCLKLLKFFSEGVDDMSKIMIQLDRKEAEALYKFTSLLTPLFEMTLFDRMAMTDEEAEQVSDAMYSLGEELRKVIE